MNLFYLALWQLMVAIVVGEYHALGNISSDQSATKSRYKRMNPIKMLILKVKINGKSKVINLVPTNQLLANENLPVWASPPLSARKYFRYPDIMRTDVGHFTMYHDYVTRSALVYFHKRRELDGIIDMMYKIEGLSIDKLDEEYTVNSGYLRFFNVWEYFEKLTPSGKNYGTGIGVECQKFRPKVYPELLIAISYDMVETIESESKFPFFVKTISHVLTVYNAVDMLFKFVKSADISVNIAAMVFESNDNEWGFQSGISENSYVDATKINNKIRTFFRSKENIFRRHSFDYIVYHTRKRLMDKKWVSILGIADVGDFKPVFMPASNGYRCNVVVRDYESYEHYATIAHELSHIFGVQHDRLFNWYFQNPCDRSVMAACGTSLCLKWSDETEKTLEKFFRSPAHCILKNKPQSLLREEPRFIFTVQQQCRCYGYESVFEQIQLHGDKCSVRVQCIDKVGEISTDLPFPMDGTPCGGDFNKVCWNKDCVTIGENEILL